MFTKLMVVATILKYAKKNKLKTTCHVKRD